jgi:hypothetical protein
MERKIYSGQLNLNLLEIGDSILNPNILLWNFIARIPPIVADTWACQSLQGSYMSTTSKIGESPMKNWERGIGIIVGTNFDAILRVEKLIMLYRSVGDGGFGLFESVNTRSIK